MEYSGGCGVSLGLAHLGAIEYVHAQLMDWAAVHGVDGELGEL